MNKKIQHRKWWLIVFASAYVMWLAFFIHDFQGLVSQSNKFDLFMKIVQTLLYGMLLLFNYQDYKDATEDKIADEES